VKLYILHLMLITK